MTVRPPDEQAIFEGARNAQTAELRDAYLEQYCGNNAVLRHRIEALLRAYDLGESFLESPPPELRTSATDSPTIERSIAERPGTVIGEYKLLQQIGEGGMGVVFMAEQTEPIQRTVALKIIKPGMDTRQVITRFEAERQALAVMDHPNIAKVLDAGTTDTGRPYFVMELVKGVPITKYCDEKQLTLRRENAPSTQRFLTGAVSASKCPRSMRPTATGNSAVDASVGTTWERPKQVSWRNVPLDHRF